MVDILAPPSTTTFIVQNPVEILSVESTLLTHLDHFDCHEQGEGEGGHDEQDGDHGHEVRTDAGALVAH